MTDDLYDLDFSAEDVDSLNDNNRIYIYKDYLGKISLELNSNINSNEPVYKIVLDLHIINYSYNRQEIFNTVDKFKKRLDDFINDLYNNAVFEDIYNLLYDIYIYIN